jgi:hypothetical protein
VRKHIEPAGATPPSPTSRTSRSRRGPKNSAHICPPSRCRASPNCCH